MNAQLEKYLDPVFIYRFTQGPQEVSDIATAQQDGLNCIALAHLAIKDLFEESLPASMHCYEMFSDQQRFTTVDTPQDMQIGDLVWFGPVNPRITPTTFEPIYGANGRLVNWRDNPVKHVALFTGQYANDYMMLHSTHYEGTNVIWPLKKFEEYRRYEKIYRISRLAISAS